MNTYTIERIDLTDESYFAAIPDDESADAIVLCGGGYAEARRYAESIGLHLVPACDGDCFPEPDDGINYSNLVI